MPSEDNCCKGKKRSLEFRNNNFLDSLTRFPNEIYEAHSAINDAMLKTFTMKFMSRINKLNRFGVD